MNFHSFWKLSLLVACLTFCGCGGAASSQDNHESLISEGLLLHSKIVTDMENGVNAKEIDKKYAEQLADYDTRRRNLTPPTQEANKKLVAEYTKPAMDLLNRMLKAA